MDGLLASTFHFALDMVTDGGHGSGDMPNAAWKEWEREMGRFTGRVRSGPMGDALPDLPGPFLDIECKYRSKIGIHQADFDQAKRNARGKMWAVALKEKNTGRRLVVMDAKEWARLLKLAEFAYSAQPELLSEGE